MALPKPYNAIPHFASRARLIRFWGFGTLKRIVEMIRKEIDVHLEALAGYINDEDKLVTYKWLSKELGVHVNLSKQILFEYWENRRENKNCITATFLLIGYLKDGGMRVEVVKEADRESAKKNFDKIISEHVYSLQKTLPELELLAITDKGDSQLSAVRCTESVIRSDHEMEVLRWGSILPGKNPPSSTSKIQRQTNTEIIKPADKTNGVSKESIAKTAAPKPADKTQKSAFNNLFAKAIDKQNKDKAGASVSSNNTKNKAKTISPPKNAWFEAVKKPKTEKEQTEHADDSVKTSKERQISAPKISHKPKSEVILDSDDSDDSLRKNTEVEAKRKTDDKSEEEALESNKTSKRKSPERTVGKIGGKKKAASSSRGKKRQSSAKSESISKRRKRIVVAESSDESSGSEMDDIREPDSPEEPQVSEKIKTCPSPPLIKCEGGRRKVRKLVDKTFMDDDGYFVTQKEYVYESCSDKEEEEVPVEVIKPSTSEATLKNTNKRKQATLFNFFKKS